MNEKKPEPTVETQSIRRQYNMVLEETKSIIDDDIKQIRISAIVLQYRELLNLCDIIDRLTADLKAKDEALEKIIIESGKVDIDNWPKQQQICQSIAESALKESDNG